MATLEVEVWEDAATDCSICGDLVHEGDDMVWEPCPIRGARWVEPAHLSCHEGREQDRARWAARAAHTGPATCENCGNRFQRTAPITGPRHVCERCT